MHSILLSPPSPLGRCLGSPGVAPSWVGVGVALCGPSPAWVGAALGVSGLRASLLGFPSGVLRWGGFPPPLGAPFVVPPGGPPSGVWGGRRFNTQTTKDVSESQVPRGIGSSFYFLSNVSTFLFEFCRVLFAPTRTPT